MADPVADLPEVTMAEAVGNVIREVKRKTKERVPRDPPLPPDPNKQHLELLRATERIFDALHNPRL